MVRFLGTGRYFTLQVVPPLIYLYLSSLHQSQHAVSSMIETLFLAIYNEEILAEGPGAENYTKKVESVRIPSIRYPSVYHDPNKLNTFPELSEMRFNSNTATLCSVQVGPYPAIEQIIGENRFLVLTRLIMTVNNCAKTVFKLSVVDWLFVVQYVVGSGLQTVL